jgi:hypothetical protein
VACYLQGGNNLKKGTLILVIAIVCVFTIGIISIVRNATLSPYDFLVKEMENDNARTPAEMLYQVNIDEGEYLIFYKDQRGIVACAIIKKKLLSYGLLRISSGIWPTNSKDPADFLFSSYKYNKGRAWISWGIIRDSSVAKVLFNGKETKIVEAKGLRICYTTGKASTSPTELVYQLLDVQGRPIFQNTD